LPDAVQALIPARLQRDNFTEGVTTPSLAAAVQAAASVSMRLVSSDKPSREVCVIGFEIHCR